MDFLVGQAVVDIVNHDPAKPGLCVNQPEHPVLLLT
jgi:hypothetical protein